MVIQGTESPTENCFLTTYHPSFTVRWWVLVHCGPHRTNCPVLRAYPATTAVLIKRQEGTKWTASPTLISLCAISFLIKRTPVQTYIRRYTPRTAFLVLSGAFWHNWFLRICLPKLMVPPHPTPPHPTPPHPPKANFIDSPLWSR